MSDLIFNDIVIWQKSSTALLLTLLAMLLLIPLARRLQLLDYPAGRKDHATPTPVVGGLAIGTGIIATTCFYQLNDGGLSQEFLAYAAASVVLLITGQLDDKYDLPWWLRICTQILAALITTVWGDVRAEQIGSLFGTTPVSLGAWSIPFTIFATVGLINALNMVDGMDGFAGSVALTALLMVGAAAVYSGNAPLVSDIATICGALISFLYFNFRFPWRTRAKAFLGNGGSAFLGFTVAWVVFRLTQTPGHPVTPTLAIWLIPVPLIDCLVLMIHRMRRGTSPFKADHNHIHHLMRDAGVSPMRTAAIVCAFSLLVGLAAALTLRANFSDAPLIIAFTGILLLWYWLTAKRERALSLLRTLSNGRVRNNRGNSSEKVRSVSLERDVH